MIARRRHRSLRRRKGAGFTMIEVMVALLLTAIAASGIIALYMVQTRSAGFSRHSTEATVLAQDEMERLRAMNVNTLTPNPTTVNGLDVNGKPGGIFSRTSRIDPASSGAYLEVTVTVSWNEGDGVGARSVKLVSRKVPST